MIVDFDIIRLKTYLDRAGYRVGFPSSAGYRVKAGWCVNVDARSIHFDPKVHADPLKFNPARFDVSLPCTLCAEK